MTTTASDPSPADRAAGSTLAIAEAFAGDRLVARVRIGGPSPYDLTAELLAWAAAGAQAGALSDPQGVVNSGTADNTRARAKPGIRRGGALGPAQAFGQEAFVAGCASVGLVELG